MSWTPNVDPVRQIIAQETLEKLLKGTLTTAEYLATKTVLKRDTKGGAE